MRLLFAFNHCWKMPVCVFIYVTIQGVGLTVLTLQLKRGMADIVAMENKLIDLALNVRARADGQVIGQDMSRHRPQVLRQTPHVQVMNTLDTLNL